jgi:hypothetical protein
MARFITYKEQARTICLLKEGMKPANEEKQIWGQQYSWGYLMPVFWENIDNPNFEFHHAVSDVFRTHEHGMAWWTATINLLASGLGWTNLTEGLHQWEKSNWQTGLHPILDFIKNHVGQNIEVLARSTALHLVSMQLIEAQWNSHSGAGEARLGSMQPEFDEKTIAEYSNNHPFDWRKALAQPLLPGYQGYDAFHLSRHLPLRSYPSVEHTVVPTTEIAANHLKIEIADFSELSFQLQQLCQKLIDGGVDPETMSVEVVLKKFGQLGNFSYSVQSERWFLANETWGIDIKELRLVHLWG